MNGIGDTWRLPRKASIASGPFSRLVEVIDKTAEIERQFELLDTRHKQLEAHVNVAERSLTARIEELAAQIPQRVAAAVANQLPEVKYALRGMIDEAVRSATAQFRDELERIAGRLTEHDKRLDQLERAHRVGRSASDKQSNKA